MTLGGHGAWGSVPVPCYGSTGLEFGDVTLSPNFQPLEIGADYVLAVVRDADEVETVALYRIRGGV